MRLYVDRFILFLTWEYIVRNGYSLKNIHIPSRYLL